jgi:hypothetical protein
MSARTCSGENSALQLGDLGAFNGQIAHQALLTEDEGDDRLAAQERVWG